MKTIADPEVLNRVLVRFGKVRPDSPRRWGTLTSHEMVCHLGDAFEMVLRTRPRIDPIRQRRRPIVKALALWGPAPWPRGMRTNPLHDPRLGGTRPSEFAADLARLRRSLQALAMARPGSLDTAHGIFGTMSVTDWQRWAYRHCDHHLRQFGV